MKQKQILGVWKQEPGHQQYKEEERGPRAKHNLSDIHKRIQETGDPPSRWTFPVPSTLPSSADTADPVPNTGAFQFKGHIWQDTNESGYVP